VPARISSVRLVCAALLGLAAALVLPSVALPAQEQPAPSGPVAPASAGAVPDHVIVVWKPGATREERLAARDDADAGFVRTLGDVQFQLLRPQAGQSVADAIAALRDDPSVQTATRDTYDVPHATTNDPLFGQLWGLQNVGANVDGFSGAIPGVDVDALAAWDRTRGTASTVVADLDTGYRFEHPDLAPVVWSNPADPANGVDDDGNGIVDDTHGADFVGNDARAPTTDGDPTDDDVVDGGHGVHTAGTIGAAGNNGIGISGVAQDVRIMPLRVCHPSCPSASQISAINYAGAHGARAANMSLGGPTANPAVQAAIAANPQVLFVLSAGNGDDPIRRDGIGDDNDVIPAYPCSYPLDNIICVAALNQADGLASFSNFGATSVDVGAPGTEILSTFPRTTPLEDTFEAADFASRWTATGAQGGFARTNEAPLTSFGMGDSPGATPVANSVRESTSAGVTIPAGLKSCQIHHTRALSLGGGTYSYRALLNGVEIVSSTGATRSGAFFLDVDDADVAPGGRLQLAFRYTAGGAPSASDGVWLDDVSFTCMQAVGQAAGFDFRDGTSMAAPHVTGAAALLFSLNPSASAAQVRAALLATVHPVAALAGKTTTGGRIDAALALDEIRQPDTSIASAPRRSTRSSRAVFAFARSDAPLGGGFQCQLDGGAFTACASPATYTVRRGRHSFAVRALSPREIVADPSPATATWTLVQCKVPRLKGKSLRRARRALRAAHCKVGRVKTPRGARVGRLVVTKSKPRAGAVRADGTRVRLALGTPQPRHRRHGRHGRHERKRRR
jgi:subtilisin family serine protease